MVKDVKGYAGGYIAHLSTGLQVIHTIHNLHHNDAATHQNKTLCTIMKYNQALIYSGIENNSITNQSILTLAWIMHSVLHQRHGVVVHFRGYPHDYRQNSISVIGCKIVRCVRDTG